MQHDPRLHLIAESFQRLLGRPLLDVSASANLSEALWCAPQVIVAHGVEEDPVFFYGNQQALSLFEMEFTDFIQLPSRFSAEPVQRDERERLLERVTRDGFIDDYAGVRISARGQRFRIEQAVVWNLMDSEGRKHGQAATFSQWHRL